MLRNIVNCKNCGAPLHYNFKNRIATCEYCTSEYHLDDLGIIEEYKVELDIFGKRVKFYITNIEVEHDYCEYRNIDGRRGRLPQKDTIKLELISY